MCGETMKLAEWTAARIQKKNWIQKKLEEYATMAKYDGGAGWPVKINNKKRKKNCFVRKFSITGW